MARARNIKPALFKNELLGVADPHLTLLFISLWTLADKEGRIEDRPLRIKAETFPYREGLDINGYLTELQRLGFIVRYVVDQQALIQVVNFKKHQTPHNTEKPSDLPSLESETVDSSSVESASVNSPLNNRENVNALPPDSLLLIPDSLNLIPEKHSSPSGSQPAREKNIKDIVEQKPKKEKSTTDNVSVNEVFEFWKVTLNHEKSKLDDKRKKSISSAIGLGYSVDDLKLAIVGCSKTPHNMGRNDRNEKYDDISLILRDAGQIDRFIGNSGGSSAVFVENTLPAGYKYFGATA